MIPSHPDSAETGARIGELLRLQVLLDGPSLSHDEIRAYVADRLEALYPLDYHVYRRRWSQFVAGTVPGDTNWPRLNYLEWRQAVEAQAEELRLAQRMLAGEPAARPAGMQVTEAMASSMTLKYCCWHTVRAAHNRFFQRSIRALRLACCIDEPCSCNICQGYSCGCDRLGDGHSHSRRPARQVQTGACGCTAMSRFCARWAV